MQRERGVLPHWLSFGDVPALERQDHLAPMEPGPRPVHAEAWRRHPAGTEDDRRRGKGRVDVS